MDRLSTHHLLKPWAFAGVLLVLTLAAYWPAMHTGFIWDDDSYVQENATLRAPDGMRQIWFVPLASPQYYPMVFTSFYIEHALWGLAPAGYHIDNVLLHAGSAVLLWLILQRLRVPGAALAAAIFAVHPVMVESVAWVTERKNTLSAFFMLASALAYLRFALPGEQPGEEKSVQGERTRWGFYAGALGLFVLALLSKSVTFGLPVVLLLILWWKRPRLTLGDTGLLAPFLVLGVAMAACTSWLEVNHVRAQGAAWNFSFLDRMLIAGRALCFYAGKLVYPGDLCFFYPRWTIDAAAWWQYLYPVAALGGLAALWAARGRIGKAPFVAALAFCVMLFPALGFFNFFPMLFSLVADHFQYHAALALIPLFAAVLTIGAARWLGARGYWGVVLAAPLLAVLGWQTYVTCGNYADPKTLWLSIIDRHPHWNAYVGLSAELAKEASALELRGRHQQAQALIDQAIDADNHALALRPNYEAAYNNLGSNYLFKRDYARSIEYYKKAVAVNADSYRFHYGLGKAYAASGQPQLAADEYLAAIRLNPQNASQHVALAGLLVDLGQVERARLYIANAQYLDPQNAEAHLLQGFLFMNAEHFPEAIAEFDQAVRAEPDNVEALDTYARATAVYRAATVADLEHAEALAARAVERTGRSNPNYLDTLGMLYHCRGKEAEAIATVKEALALLPATAGQARAPLLRHLAAYQAATAPATR